MKPTVYPGRDSWLADRDGRIGASEVACILGANPYKSAFTLWHEKKGLVPKTQAGIAARVGLALEPLLAEFYQDESSRLLVDPGPYTVYTHPEHPWLTCTPDRLFMDGEKIRAVVELKTIGEYVAQKMRDGEPPLSYQVQLQAQLEILGCAYGDLACLIGNRKFEVFAFSRHDRLISQMIPRLKAFWESLQDAVPPAVDESQSTTQTLKALHTDDNGEVSELTRDAKEAYKQMKALKAQIKGLEEVLNGHKNVIIEAIGANTWAEDEDLRLSYKTQQRAAAVKVKPETIPLLDSAGIDYTITPEAKYRVLREERKRNNDK